MRSIALWMSLVGTAAFAEAPLTAEAFNTLSEGRIMTWAEFGRVYGVEQYLPDRRVRWTVTGDDCKTGHWYADGPLICFIYEDLPDPVCWEMTQSTTGLHARHSAVSPEADPVVIEDTSKPFACLGPEVGV